MNRLGDNNIVVFQFINKSDAESICEYKLKSILHSLYTQKNIRIDIKQILPELKRKAILGRANGGRGIGNMLEREFLNPLSEFMCTLDDYSKPLKCTLDSYNNIKFGV